MTITRNFKLYLNAGTASAPYINVNQYDEGEEWVFTLYNEDGSTYTPSTGAIIGIKSDGNAIMNSGSVVGGKVVITETEQMTAASGKAIYELLIDNATHGTANFIVNVERRPSDDAEFSDSDLSMLQEAIDAAEVINEILDEGGDPSEIIEENVNAWLDNHPEATTTVEDGAITAPKINNSLWDKLLVSEEASGAVASFDDGADDVPVSSLKVALEPVQLGSGDPSPSNIRPIVAANGINVWDEVWELGGISNQNGTNYGANDRIRSKNYIPCLPSTTYYFKTPATMGTVAYYDSSQTFISALSNFAGGTFTTPANTKYIKFCGTNAYGATYNNDISINYPSTYTAYQPYQGIMVDVVGRNLFGGLITTTGTQYGVTYTANLDGTFTVNGTNNSSSVSDYRISGTGTYRLDLPVGNYVLNGGAYGTNGTGNTLYITIKDANNQTRYVGNNGTADSAFSIAEGEYIVSPFIRFAANGTANNLVFKPMIRRADDTDSDYEPYASASYPYTLGQTVYGGTVDLATGVLTVDKVLYTFTGNENPYIQQTGIVAIKAFQGSAKAGSSAPAVCSHFVAVAGGEYAYITTAMTDAELKTFMANNTVTIAYNLETPQTINLTPQEVKTLLGYNNISSSGTVDVIYHADTKLYIDKRIAELG